MSVKRSLMVSILFMGLVLVAVTSRSQPAQAIAYEKNSAETEKVVPAVVIEEKFVTMTEVVADVNVITSTGNVLLLTHTPLPTHTLLPTHTPIPSNTPKPTRTPMPSLTPLPTHTPLPSHTPLPTLPRPTPYPDPYCALDGSYDNGRLYLNYDFYTSTEPVLWSNQILISDTWYALWSVELPRNFTYQNTISFPFGTLGTVVVYMQLDTYEGTICSDYAVIQTQ